jgi:hypothetical protein
MKILHKVFGLLYLRDAAGNRDVQREAERFINFDSILIFARLQVCPLFKRAVYDLMN